MEGRTPFATSLCCSTRQCGLTTYNRQRKTLPALKRFSPARGPPAQHLQAAGRLIVRCAAPAPARAPADQPRRPLPLEPGTVLVGESGWPGRRGSERARSTLTPGPASDPSGSAGVRPSAAPPSAALPPKEHGPPHRPEVSMTTQDGTQPFFRDQRVMWPPPSHVLSPLLAPTLCCVPHVIPAPLCVGSRLLRSALCVGVLTRRWACSPRASRQAPRAGPGSPPGKGDQGLLGVKTQRQGSALGGLRSASRCRSLRRHRPGRPSFQPRPPSHLFSGRHLRNQLGHPQPGTSQHRFFFFHFKTHFY